jgi:hypothetical protein
VLLLLWGAATLFLQAPLPLLLHAPGVLGVLPAALAAAVLSLPDLHRPWGVLAAGFGTTVPSLLLVLVSSNITFGRKLFLLLLRGDLGDAVLVPLVDAAGQLCWGCCCRCGTLLLRLSRTAFTLDRVRGAAVLTAQLLSLLLRGPYMLHVGGPICVLVGRPLLLWHTSVSTKRAGL